MKKEYIDLTGFRSALQSLKAKLDSRFSKEAKRVDELVGADRESLNKLQEQKADKATTLEGYGIKDALPSDTPYAKSPTVAGSASSFVTSILKDDRNLPLYFASDEATEVAGVSAHDTDLYYNPGTGTLKAKLFDGTFRGTITEAIEFSEPAAVELVGDVEGKVLSRKGWTVETEIAPRAVTSEKIADRSVANTKLENSDITIGAQKISLGDSVYVLSGLQKVQSEEFEGKLKGTADRAISDENGNTIIDTYATKQEHAYHENRINAIENKIPAQATSENSLADKSFVTDAINSVSAYYITATVDGEAFASKQALQKATREGNLYFAGSKRVPTRNDYCLVNKDESHNNMASRYVYQGDNVWAFQYVISQVSFTTAQQKAIDSGITKDYLDTVSSHLQSTDNPHNVTPEQLHLADVATSGSYKDLSNITTLDLRSGSTTGNAITGITVDDHTITVNKDTTFLTEHPAITLSTPTSDRKVATVFNVVDSLVQDKNGHITGYNTTEISIPTTEYSVTYVELVDLRNKNRLVAGTSYKITDYEFKTSLPGVISGNHPFYITLEALSSNLLSPVATLSPIEGDTYFGNINLSQWSVRYTLDNDTLRYPWGSSTGKGIIYYMKDHNNNECCYDFKNLMFYLDASKYNTPIESRHYYTFSQLLPAANGYDVADASNLYCDNNKISLYQNSIGTNVFIFEGGDSITLNTLEECNNNLFVGTVINNTFDNGAVGNEMVGSIVNNTFDQNFSRNLVLNSMNNCIVLSNTTDNVFYGTIAYSKLDHGVNHCIFYTSVSYSSINGSSYLSLACYVPSDSTKDTSLEMLTHLALSNIQIDRALSGSSTTRALINVLTEALGSTGTVYFSLDAQNHPICYWDSDKLTRKFYYMESITADSWKPAPSVFLAPADVATVAITGDYENLSNKAVLSAKIEGVGNAVTGISVDNHSITLNKATTFLQQGDIEEISTEDLNDILAIFSTGA